MSAKKNEPTKMSTLLREAAACVSDPAKLKEVMKAVAAEVEDARKAAEKVAEDVGGREKLFRAAAARYITQAYPSTESAAATMIGDHTPKFSEDIVGTLRAGQGGEGNVAAYPVSFEEYGRANWRGTDVGATLRASGGCLGGGSETLVDVPDFKVYQENTRSEVREVEGEVAGAICASPSGKQYNIVSGLSYFDFQAIGKHKESDVASTLTALDSKDARDLVVKEGSEAGYLEEAAKGSYAAAFMGGQGKDAGSIAYSETVSPTLKGAASGSNQVPTVVVARRKVLTCGIVDDASKIAGLPMPVLVDLLADVAASRKRTHKVRKLTDIEVCRLQGFPDNWPHVEAPEGKRGNAGLSDEALSQRLAMYAEQGIRYTAEEVRSFVADADVYKAAGNSIACPALRAVFVPMAEHLKDVMGDRMVWGGATA